MTRRPLTKREQRAVEHAWDGVADVLRVDPFVVAASRNGRRMKLQFYTTSESLPEHADDAGLLLAARFGGWQVTARPLQTGFVVVLDLPDLAMAAYDLGFLPGFSSVVARCKQAELLRGRAEEIINAANSAA